MSQFADLNREEAAQLDNFVDLLIDLSIVEPSKQVSEASFTQEQLDENNFSINNQNHSQNPLNSSQIPNSDNMSSVEIDNDGKFATEKKT